MSVTTRILREDPDDPHRITGSVREGDEPSLDLSPVLKELRKMRAVDRTDDLVAALRSAESAAASRADALIAELRSIRGTPGVPAPPAREPWGGEYDLTALVTVRSMAKISHPVTIHRFSKGERDADGTVRAGYTDYVDGTIKIMIGNWLTRDEAEDVFWHEVCHGSSLSQALRRGFTAEQWLDDYHRRRDVHEVEARAYVPRAKARGYRVLL